MQTITERLEQHFSQAKTEIENEVLSFYISFLMDSEPGQRLKTATRIITRAQRQILRAPKGENERKALDKFSVTKISYLSAQLRDALASFTAELQMEEEGLPETIGKRFNKRLAELLEKTLAAMENEIYKNLCIDISAQELSGILKAVLRKFIKNVALEAETYYAKAAQYRVLKMQEEAGLKEFAFSAKSTEGTCAPCHTQDTNVYTLKELLEKDLIPPLHPNCKCILVPAENLAEAKNWYEPLLRIPADAWKLLSANLQANQEHANAIKGWTDFPAIADWLTMGIISGAWNANAERTDAFQKDPNWYTFGDWITLGFVGTADRALNPDKPLSLQHWLDTFFVMSSIYSGYTAVKKNISLNNRIKQFETSAKTHDMLGESYGVEGGSGAKIGDFTNLEGSTVDDILDRIPDEATLRELHPVQGGATDGFEFKWVQDGQTYRARVHSADPGAPAGSNASNGWVVRIQRGKQYYDPTINDFRPAKYTNPNGDFFDESIMNNTHIPIKDPYNP